MTAPEIPVWFMDVDGVLNFFSRGTLPADACTGEATPYITAPYAENVMFPITWRTSIIERIMSMHDEGIVEVKWLTTWGRGANYGLHELIGFPRLEVVADPEEQPYRSMGWHTWWKNAAVRAYLLNNSPSKIVWTDDDLHRHKELVANVHELVPTMMISPDEHKGLTHHQLDLIEAFLRDPDVQTTGDGI